MPEYDQIVQLAAELRRAAEQARLRADEHYMNDEPLEYLHGALAAYEDAAERLEAFVTRNVST
jgi:hypothetical protein